jgi:uncharacterized protein (TIGR03086 family)
MELLVALDDAHGLARRRVAGIKPEDWDLSTPCDDWDVGGVANHLITVMVIYDALLTDTCSPELLESLVAIQRTPDTVGAVLEDASRRLRDRFAAPGMLTRRVAHPVAPDGSTLARISVCECCIHSWDIAQAVGVDGTFSEDLAQIGYDGAAPSIDRIREIGFTKTSTTDEPTDDSVQVRLLHLFGRC